MSAAADKNKRQWKKAIPEHRLQNRHSHNWTEHYFNIKWLKYLPDFWASPSWNSETCKYTSSANYQNSWDQGGGVVYHEQDTTRHTFATDRKGDKQLSAPSWLWVSALSNQSVHQSKIMYYSKTPQSLSLPQGTLCHSGIFVTVPRIKSALPLLK